jgi:4-hydroxybenzoyl-CoA thioesterase
MSRSFLHPVTIRFGWCDPAGILYYPRYFDLFHQAMESWFGAALGLPYGDFIRGGRGVPSVHAEADFVAPCTLGETVQVALTVEAVGRSSLRFAYRVVGPDGGERATGRVVTVLMDLDPASETFRRAIPITGDFRDRVMAWRASTADAGVAGPTEGS